MAVRCCLCELGAPRGEPHALFEFEHAGRDQRGDLPERVAGERDDVVELRARGFPREERGAQHRELRVARARELLGGGVQEQ